MSMELPPNVLPLSAIASLAHDDHKLFRLTALLEARLRQLDPSLRVARIEGRIIKVSDGDVADLDQLITYHAKALPNPEDVHRARIVRNSLAHARDDARLVSNSEIANAVAQLTTAIEALENATVAKSAEVSRTAEAEKLEFEKKLELIFFGCMSVFVVAFLIVALIYYVIAKIAEAVFAGGAAIVGSVSYLLHRIAEILGPVGSSVVLLLAACVLLGLWRLIARSTRRKRRNPPIIVLGEADMISSPLDVPPEKSVRGRKGMVREETAGGEATTRATVSRARNVIRRREAKPVSQRTVKPSKP
jgi:hypothetical protein